MINIDQIYLFVSSNCYGHSYSKSFVNEPCGRSLVIMKSSIFSLYPQDLEKLLSLDDIGCIPKTKCIGSVVGLSNRFRRFVMHRDNCESRTSLKKSALSGPRDAYFAHYCHFDISQIFVSSKREILMANVPSPKEVTFRAVQCGIQIASPNPLRPCSQLLTK
jgi:hypothetical protein